MSGVKHSFIISLLTVISSYAALADETEIKYVRISDNLLEKELNTFIELERTCEYFDNDLLVFVRYRELENTPVFTFETSHDLNLAVKVKPMGYSKNNGLQVFFYGFEASKNEYLIALEQTKEISVSTNDGILVNDDSYSMIQYRTVEGKWEAFSKQSRCY